MKPLAACLGQMGKSWYNFIINVIPLKNGIQSPLVMPSPTNFKEPNNSGFYRFRTLIKKSSRLDTGLRRYDVFIVLPY